MTIQTWIKNNQHISYHDKKIILQYVLKKTQLNLYQSLQESLNKKQIRKCQNIIKQYAKGKPLAYLLKNQEFYGFLFHVEKGVLIPRPETEILVSQTLKLCPKNKPFYLMDIGCGSGCIGLSILKKNKMARLLAVDQSKKALQVTQKNAIRLGVLDRVQIIHSNILKLCKNSIPSCQIAVANPPYISLNDPYIHRSVLKYEPHKALFSGVTGLESIFSWLHKISSLMKQGHYLFEIGYNQHELIHTTLASHPCIHSFYYHNDFSGIKRLVHCQFTNEKMI